MKIQLPAILSVHAAFGAVMAALLVVGTVAYRSDLASSESAQWAQHTNEVLEHLANLRLGMENIASGYRDFASVDDEQRTLRVLTADNPRQQRRLNIIADLRQRMVQRKVSWQISSRPSVLPQTRQRDFNWRSRRA
jgi:CHASE3 domain sensor protein